MIRLSSTSASTHPCRLGAWRGSWRQEKTLERQEKEKIKCRKSVPEQLSGLDKAGPPLEMQQSEEELDVVLVAGDAVMSSQCED